jgi:hypothetical protein
MPDFLQQLDLDYYRAARLLIARAQLEQLRKEHLELADIERRSKIPLGTSPLVNGGRLLLDASFQSDHGD